MSMISYEQFFPHTQIHASEAPEPLLQAVVRDACIEFCRETLWLQQDLDPIPVQAGINPYEIDMPAQHRVVQLLSLYYDTQRITKLAQMTAHAASLTNWQTLSGTPLYYVCMIPSEITLVPIPDRSLNNALTGRVAMAPTRDSTTVDDSLYERFVEEISYGASGKLMLIPGYKFSDPNAAAVRLASFRAGINRTRIQVNAGLMAAPLSVHLRGAG